MVKEIETKRLILRNFISSDLDNVYEYAKVEGVGEMAGWPSHKNKEESKKILEEILIKSNDLAIYLKDEKKVIGSIGFKDVRKEYEKIAGKGIEIGYVLSKDYWGKSLMSEGLRAVIKNLFNSYDYLSAGCFLKNERSKNLLYHLGFSNYSKGIIETRFGTAEESLMLIYFKKDYLKR